MQLKDAIEKRRTVRDFQSKKIPITIIEYAINNEFKALSQNYLREWDFIILNSMEAKLKLIATENIYREIDINLHIHYERW